ncbi:MAG: MATE family efflux transporter [Lachnospiraceae bacterium]|nr:MATE family efflux transporter [Lachnospiraceae bacterium]
MNDRKEIFENAPVRKAVFTMAIPTIISMLVVVVYNMADTYFIGKTNDEMQVAAVSLATPVFMLFMALGNLFGIGGCSSISRALGEKNDERAKKISAFCCYSSVCIGIIMIILFMTCMDWILKIIKASPNTIDYAREYLTYVAFGAPFIMFATAFGNIVRGEGATRSSMIGNLIGTVVNIILDPIMILVLDMGVKGAAIATVIGNICASIFYIGYFIFRKNTALSIRLKHFSARENIAFGVLAIGIPASLNNMLMSVANILLNNVLGKYGDIPVAGMGVAMKANMLAVLLQIGLCTGIQPLIGYSYGAGNKKRLKDVFKFTALCAIIMGTALTVLLAVFREGIISGFIDKPEVVDIGIKMMMALQISCPVIGILFLCVNTLQGMGKALPSLILTLCRQGVAFIPMLYILDRLFAMNGAIYAQCSADFISILIALGITLTIIKRMDKVA